MRVRLPRGGDRGGGRGSDRAGSEFFEESCIGQALREAAAGSPGMLGQVGADRR
jgi:hypothetical protein